MLKKMKKMKRPTIASILTVLVFSLFLTSAVVSTTYNKSKAEPDGVINAPKTTKTAKVKKPAQVKGLKKVKESRKWDGRSNVSSVKIKFNKVKGATGYQVLLYRTNRGADDLTPLVFAFNTKKTTYTIKNMVPDFKYTIRVRAYTKGKDGKIVYGKTRSLKIKTGGQRKGWIFVCNSCGACMGNGDLLGKHTRDVYNIHHELHGGYTFYKK